MLFYIVSQVEAPVRSETEDRGRGDRAAHTQHTQEVVSGRWNVPQQTVEALLRCLQPGEDEVVKHYAAKTIENVSSSLI